MLSQSTSFLNYKLVQLVLKAFSLATFLLSLFSSQAVKLLTAVASPFLSHYQLARDIAQRVQLVLEVTASDHGRSHAPQLQGAAVGVPAPVRRYLEYALPEGTPQLKLYRITQSGYFRFLPGAATSPSVPSPAAASADDGKDWKKITGEAYVSVAPRPGLVWSATIQLSPLTWIRGFAGYLRGRGSTKWKLCSLFRVEDVPEGERCLDTVALLRFLAEAPCYPTALLPSAYLKWEPVDETSARAIITDSGLRASAVFRFNALGQIVGMRTTDSARSVGRGALSRDPYACYYRCYKRMGPHGLRVPTEVEAAWELAGGEYSYAQLQVESLTCWDSMEMPTGTDVGAPGL